MKRPFSPLALLLVTSLTSQCTGPGIIASEPSAPMHTPAPIDTAAPMRAAQVNFDHAVLISVDGLRSDTLVSDPPEKLPGFQRLMQGAFTLNARTDPDFTITLPNHTGMLTGRPVLGDEGHGWIKNDDADEGETLHSNKKSYVPGIFDVAHDRGFSTALYAGKSKFSIYDASWNAANGAPDVTGQDDGRDKLDTFGFTLKTEEITDGVLKSLRDGGPKSLVFAHYAVTDLTAHFAGWDVTPGSKYMKAVEAVDKEIVRILDAIQKSDRLRGHTAVIVTADHGGGAPARSHETATMWIDYIIPFLVWTGAAEPGDIRHDLYALNARTRCDPSLRQPKMSDPALPPIRNADAGNLALSLLGLPAVPGSTINAKQDLIAR